MKNKNILIIVTALAIGTNANARPSAFCTGMLAGLTITVAGSIFVKNPVTRLALVGPYALVSLSCLVPSAEAAEVVKDPQKAYANNRRFRELSDSIGMPDATMIYQMIADEKPPELISDAIKQRIITGPLS